MIVATYREGGSVVHVDDTYCKDKTEEQKSEILRRCEAIIAKWYAHPRETTENKTSDSAI
jgi:hypothetical protein